MKTHPCLFHFNQSIWLLLPFLHEDPPVSPDKRKVIVRLLYKCFALQKRKGIMSQKPLTMEQLKQVLQLKKDGIAIREIVRRTGISRNAIKRYLCRLQPPGGDPAAELSNKQLAGKAYDNDVLLFTTDRRDALMKHFIYAEKELHKTGVNRQMLWVEYKEQHPDGYTYSRYCYHFNIFLKHTDVSMHLEYEAGDMIMIDFAGKKLRYMHPPEGGGEVTDVEVFIAILPFSGLIFCTAVHSQRTADFVSCINAMLKFYGAVPKTILCDNLKTACKTSQ
jgi:transposase